MKYLALRIAPILILTFILVGCKTTLPLLKKNELLKPTAKLSYEKKILEAQSKPRIGIQFTGNLRILEVIQDSPAQKSGLQVGDMIVKLNGENVANQQTFTKKKDVFSPGDTITLSVKRAGERKNIPIILSATPRDEAICEYFFKLGREDKFDYLLNSVKESLKYYVSPSLSRCQHYALAMAYQGLSDFDNAIKYYKKYLGLKDTNKYFKQLAYLNLGSIYASAKHNYAGAIEVLNAYLNLKPHYEKKELAEVFTTLGWVYVKKAEKKFNESGTALFPGLTASQVKSNARKAIVNLNQAVNLHPAEYAYLNLGNSEVASRNWISYFLMTRLFIII
tara:strand:+ start:3904 stop:4908 length:1005 start_codon:yes stop_codon:yes gene_type:complete